MDYEKIDVCKNNCMLFMKEHAGEKKYLSVPRDRDTLFCSMKTLHSYDTPRSHGEQHPTPPHGSGLGAPRGRER
jgi:hypothetical protein